MRFVFIILLASTYLLAQESFTVLSISPFYTNGKYSNQIISDSKSFYGTVNFNGEFLFSTGIDFISLNKSEWDYDQNSLYFSVINSFSSLSVKLAGVYANGDYKDGFNDLFNYTDENLSLTSELIFNYNWNYFGVAYNYFSSTKGFQVLKASNITFRYDKFLDLYTYLSIRPNIYFENSGRKLFSLSSKLAYYFSSDLVANINFTLGGRRYYFDNDLLTFYNQYDIQKIVLGAGFDYSFIDEINFTAGFQHTKFENFSINYFFIGLRTKFYF